MNLNESNLYYINNKYLKEMISYSSDDKDIPYQGMSHGKVLKIH